MSQVVNYLTNWQLNEQLLYNQILIFKSSFKKKIIFIFFYFFLNYLIKSKKFFCQVSSLIMINLTLISILTVIHHYYVNIITVN